MSVVFSLLARGQSLPELIAESDFSIGKTLRIHSDVLDEERVLNVYLPASYSVDRSKEYPVIYLLDGSSDEDFIHVSGIVQFASFPWINRIPESIVVGIANVDRKRDFTYPSNSKIDQEEFPTSGYSERFINFLENELHPFIDSAFRTTATRTIIGQSLGGLLATEILFKKPQLFDNYVIVSPSLWWDDEGLLKAERKKIESQKSIYIAVGKEGEVMERTARELYDQLKGSGDQNTRVNFEFLEDKTHGDALHMSVYNAFGWLFGASSN